jgi:CRP-like cAMP-binding protein
MIAVMSQLAAALERLPSATVRGRQGETLFSRGDSVRFLYRVRSGAVHLSRMDISGKPAVMQRAAPGDVLAEASLFSDAYHCDAVVVADAELARLGKADVLAAMAADPALLQDFTAHLAGEVQRTRSRVEVLTRRTVAERLDGWLALHDEGLPALGQRRWLAEEIGVSPEALYRELARRRRTLAR